MVEVNSLDSLIPDSSALALIEKKKAFTEKWHMKSYLEFNRHVGEKCWTKNIWTDAIIVLA